MEPFRDLVTDLLLCHTCPSPADLKWGQLDAYPDGAELRWNDVPCRDLYGRLQLDTLAADPYSDEFMDFQMYDAEGSPVRRRRKKVKATRQKGRKQRRKM